MKAAIRFTDDKYMEFEGETAFFDTKIDCFIIERKDGTQVIITLHSIKSC